MPRIPKVSPTKTPPVASNIALVELREFKLGTKVFARKRRQLGPVLISVEFGYLIIESGDTKTVMHATGEWQGRVHCSPEVLRAVATVPPAEDPVRIAYADDRITIGMLTVPCQWEPVSRKFMKVLKEPDLLDLLAMGRSLPRTELLGTPLGQKVAGAEEDQNERVRRAAAELGPLGISNHDLTQLVAQSVKKRITERGGRL